MSQQQLANSAPRTPAAAHAPSAAGKTPAGTAGPSQPAASAAGSPIEPSGRVCFRNVTGKGTTIYARCDGIVAHYDPAEYHTTVLALSLAGPSMAIKGIRASLATAPTACSFDWYPPGQPDRPSHANMRAFPGYRFSQPHRLGFGMFHMCILAKMPTLLHSRMPETMWQHLEKTTTTPLKREWMSWIIPALKSAQQIVEPTLQHGLSMALCFADDNLLDKLVSHEVYRGKVKV